jgi:hypothetical protein
MLLLFMFGVGVALLATAIGMSAVGASRLEQALKNSGHYEQYRPWLGPTNILRISRFAATSSPQAGCAAQQMRAAAYIGTAAIVLIVIPALLSDRLPPANDLPWRQPLSGVHFAASLAFIAFIGAAASWIAGGALYLMLLRSVPDSGRSWITVFIWPFVPRISGAAGEPAARLNKALVAFVACVLVGLAAFSASASLHHFAK